MKNELINHIEKLKYFKSIAECESFYRASLKLRISQPALTRSIQTLENVLDMKVFNRSRRGVKLTNEGLSLLNLANDIFSKVKDWNISTLENKVTHQLKQFRIGTYDNMATSLLPQLIKNLEQEYGIIDFKILTAQSNNSLSLELLEKKIDYILLAEPQKQRGVSYQLVGLEKYGFYASTQFLEKEKIIQSTLSLDDFKKFRLLTIPEAIAGKSSTVDRLLWEETFSRTSRFNSFEVVKSVMIQNMGIGLIPTISIWQELVTKKVKPLFIKGAAHKNLGSHEIYFCSRAQNNESEFLYLAKKIRHLILDIQKRTLHL